MKRSYLWWLGWLFLGFLPAELRAASNREKGDTFSEWVWHVFYTRWRKGVLLAFLLSLTSHLVFGTTVVPVAVCGAAVGAIFTYWAAKER